MSEYLWLVVGSVVWVLGRGFCGQFVGVVFRCVRARWCVTRIISTHIYVKTDSLKCGRASDCYEMKGLDLSIRVLPCDSSQRTQRSGRGGSPSTGEWRC